MLKDLIRYTEIADQKVIDTFLSAEQALPQAEALFSHILNAQHIWLNRIKGDMAEFERFAIHSKQEFETIHQVNMAELKEVLNSTELSKIISYTISTGEAYETAVADILLHIVNHSTYHRGQVATQFKLNNITPPVTDYVFLKRQGEF